MKIYGAWKNILAILAIGLVLLVSGCVNPPPATTVFNYQEPSRPILSSQERANLTEADIIRIIQRGDEAYENGNYTLAKNLYYEVILALPEPNLYVLNTYAVCLANLGLYENAVMILNMVLEIDPYNETARDNIAICRQFIAQQTAEQRQRELQAQQQQQESFNNLIGSLNSLSASVAQVQQNRNSQSGGQGESSGGQSVSSGGSSSSRDTNNFDIARAKRSYERDARNAESAWRNIKSSGDVSGQQRQTFQQCQTRMRRTREEAARNGHTITKSKWEDERLP